MANRLPVKWIRDFNKRKYSRGDTCEICGTNENVEFHHFYSLTLLYEKWVAENNIDISNIQSMREEFTNTFRKELFDETVNICKQHHANLHKIYGVTPALFTVEKQKNWIKIQAAKFGRTYEFKGMA